ncbi:MAG: decaprenylphospho-beta-D-erythro-pentofuranosid-2-ulose 2-reductase [Corynebacterium sp.]|nr:decaprenylphospho-beta-D-erythro-pentofuranosid-2-ulose 2-reductase [Corynebacterium sp.]
MLNAVGKPQTILVLGGTSDIGNAVVKEFLHKGPIHIILGVRPGEAGIDETVQGLTAAGASKVDVLDFDATDFDSHEEVINKAFAIADIDVAIIAFAVQGDNEEAWQNQRKAVQLAQINYTGSVSVGVLLGQKMKEQGHGSIVIFSSAAGVRVRRSNFVYGSSKAGVDGFFLQLGEALRGTGVNVTVIRPGQVRTKLTAGMKEAPLTLDREQVAKMVVDGVINRKDLVWAPPAFALVMAVITHIPRKLMRYMPF